MFPDSMRASDADRQRVAEALQEQTGQGRLTLEEFEQRSAAAYAATTLGELRALTTDLPVDVLPLAAMNTGEVSRKRQRNQMPTVLARPAVAVAAAVLVLMLVGSVVGTAVTGHLIFPFPLLIFGFFVLRRLGNRGPGYPH